MSLFGNWSADALVGAAEKCIAKMDDADLARALVVRSAVSNAGDREALLETVFDAFRDRGESSQDACEGAATTLDQLRSGDRAALVSLLDYACQSPGVLKEALTFLVERQPASINDLPPELVESISRRLAGSA
ncbi:MAG TPA: hypothetical protein VMS32_03675 [Verrucomicrobiae bacterium]|jgi:hypothetical protein|nr:hypothetical protein [Verrucomicrobiae bacterium]